MFCSFTNTSRHDITEILLKVAFKHHRTNQCIITVYYTCCKFYNMQCFWNNDIIIAINYQRKLTHTNVYCPWKVECKAGVFPFSPSMFLLPLFCLFHLRLLLTLIFYPHWNTEISQNRPFLVDFLEPMAVEKSNTNPLECQLSVNNAKTSTCNLKRYQNVGTDVVFSSPDPKGQVSYSHHLASVVVVRRPSVVRRTS